jgi:uncharacterized protein YjiS (DUF1127 family)
VLKQHRFERDLIWSGRGKFEAHGQISPISAGERPWVEQADARSLRNDDFFTEIIVSTISRAPAVAQTAATPSWTAILQAKFRVWKDAYITWRIEQAAMQQLGRMSDHDLRDIGLARSEINHAVTHGAACERGLGRRR